MNQATHEDVQRNEAHDEVEEIHHYVEPPKYVAEPEATGGDGPLTHVAILDCETTDLGDDDEPVSIGVLLLGLAGNGRSVLLDHWYGEREPNVPMSREAQAVNHIDPESLKGKVLDADSLQAFLQQAEVVIAHNASFDARMLYRVMPSCMNLNWRCSLHQFRRTSLDKLCLEFSVERKNAHTALGDCLDLWRVLNHRKCDSENGQTYLGNLVDQGWWPVLPSRVRVTTPDGIEFPLIDEQVCMESPVGTEIRLWMADARDDMQAMVVGYARRSGFCGGQGRVFKIREGDNEQLYSRLRSYGRDGDYKVLKRTGTEIMIGPSNLETTCVTSRDNLTDIQIDTMVALCRGMSEDGPVSQENVQFLVSWLRENQPVRDQPDVRDLFGMVFALLMGGNPVWNESRDLMIAVRAFAAGTFRPRDVFKLPPFSSVDPHAEVDLKSTKFVLAGIFGYAFRRDHEEAIKAQGGNVAAQVTKEGMYCLVVGVNTPLNWAGQEWYGKKIQKAVKYHDQGLPITIVSEDWLVEKLRHGKGRQMHPMEGSAP